MTSRAQSGLSGSNGGVMNCQDCQDFAERTHVSRAQSGLSGKSIQVGNPSVPNPDKPAYAHETECAFDLSLTQTVSICFARVSRFVRVGGVL